MCSICKIPKFVRTWTSKLNCIQLSIAVAWKHSVVSHVAAWRTALSPCWHTDPWPVCQRRLGLQEVGGHGSQQQLPPSSRLTLQMSSLFKSWSRKASSSVPVDCDGFCGVRLRVSGICGLTQSGVSVCWNPTASYTPSRSKGHQTSPAKYVPL